MISVSRRRALAFSLVGLHTLTTLPAGAQPASAQDNLREAAELERVVDEAIRPLMQQHGIPGMAVGVTAAGRQFFFSYGVASKETGQKVTEDTIFEIGSEIQNFLEAIKAA